MPMEIKEPTPYFGKKHIGIDKYINRNLRILEDMCIITDEDTRQEYKDRYYAAIKASDGNPYMAVDEEHYRILRKMM